MDKMKDYIHTYMNQKDITLETKDVYLRILKYFHTYITNQCILKIAESTIKDYILHLHQKHYAPKWIYQHISVLKGFFHYLDTHKTKLEIPSYIDTICTKNMKQVRAINQKHIHTLHPVESKHILNKLKENRRFIFGFRDYAIVLLMMTTGMRSIEIRRALIKDLKNIESKYLLYIQGKGQHVSDHMVHITPYVYEILKDYLLKRKDSSPYLFVTHGRRKKDSMLTKATLMAMFIRIEGVCGLSRGSLHGHMLRHTAANMHVSLTSNIEATQQFLRHKRTVTTYTYVNDHFNPEYANTLHNFILEESTFSFEDAFNQKKPSYKDHFLYPLTETYLNSLSIKKTSIKSYQIAYKKLLTYCIEYEITHMKTETIISFKRHMKDKGYSSYYLYVIMSALRGFFMYLHQIQSEDHKNQPSNHIMSNMKHERITPHLKKTVLSKTEAKTFLSCMKETRIIIYDYRDYAMISLMLTSALSPYDVTHVKREALQSNGIKHTLDLVKKGKYKDLYEVYLSDETYQAIQAYLSLRKDDNPYLFVTNRTSYKDQMLSRTFFRYGFRRMLKKCGLDERLITPHSLRHTAAVLSLKNGVSMHETKAFMHHKSPLSTSIYQTYVQRLESNVEQAIEHLILSPEDRLKISPK